MATIFIHFIPDFVAGGGQKLLYNFISSVPGKHILFGLRPSGGFASRFREIDIEIHSPITSLSLLYKLYRNHLLHDSSFLIFQGWTYIGDCLASIFYIFFKFHRRSKLRYYFLNTIYSPRQLAFPSRIAYYINLLFSRILDPVCFACSPSSLSSHLSAGFSPTISKVVLPSVYLPNSFSFNSTYNCRIESRSFSNSYYVPRVLMIARFDSVKNHALVFKALNIYPHVTIDFVGEQMTSHNQSLVALRDNFLSPDFHSLTRFLGTTNDVYALFDKYDFILLSSYSEGLPMCLIEASLHGLLSICSDVGDTKLASSNCGFYFNPHSVTSLVSKLKEACILLNDCSSDPSYYYQRSFACHETATSLWSTDSSINLFSS